MASTPTSSSFPVSPAGTSPASGGAGGAIGSGCILTTAVTGPGVAPASIPGGLGVGTKGTGVGRGRLVRNNGGVEAGCGMGVGLATVTGSGVGSTPAFFRRASSILAKSDSATDGFGPADGVAAALALCGGVAAACGRGFGLVATE